MFTTGGSDMTGSVFWLYEVTVCPQRQGDGPQASEATSRDLGNGTGSKGTDQNTLEKLGWCFETHQRPRIIHFVRSPFL